MNQKTFVSIVSSRLYHNVDDMFAMKHYVTTIMLFLHRQIENNVIVLIFHDYL